MSTDNSFSLVKKPYTIVKSEPLQISDLCIEDLLREDANHSFRKNDDTNTSDIHDESLFSQIIHYQFLIPFMSLLYSNSTDAKISNPLAPPNAELSEEIENLHQKYHAHNERNITKRKTFQEKFMELYSNIISEDDELLRSLKETINGLD